MVAALLSRMNYLEDERASRARKIGELTECVENQTKQIRQLQQDAVDLQNHLEGREAHFEQEIELRDKHIQTIENSRAWAFVTRLRKMRFWLCPSGSRRERAYRYIIDKLGL
jgi:predicted  nucleic acid-binding Zn-ribbon protein